MKYYFLQIILLVYSLSFSQDALQKRTKAKDKCYAQSVSEDVFKEQEKRVIIQPSYKVFKKTPAVYKKVEQIVLVQEAYTELVIVPEVWENKTVFYTKKEPSNIIYTEEAVFKDSLQVLMTKPEYSDWEQVKKTSGCDNSEECKEWIYKKYPSEYISIPTIAIDEKAVYTKHKIPQTVSVYNVKHIVEPAQVKEIKVEAVYDTIIKYVLVKDAFVEEELIPEVYKNERQSSLVEKGGVHILKDIDCSLLDYRSLNIEWDLKSAVLTREAKQVIENEMIPFLRNYPNIKLEIASHTDDRGPEDLNLNLSERRSISIVNYLLSKGIDNKLLEAKGYGESKPLYKCTEDEGGCLEKERSENRRVEYRLVSFN